MMYFDIFDGNWSHGDGVSRRPYIISTMGPENRSWIVRELWRVPTTLHDHSVPHVTQVGEIHVLVTTRFWKFLDICWSVRRRRNFQFEHGV